MILFDRVQKGLEISKESKVKYQFVDMIYDLFINGFKQPLYGKLGYGIKRFYENQDWVFFYDDSNVARKAAILSQIEIS